VHRLAVESCAADLVNQHASHKFFVGEARIFPVDGKHDHLLGAAADAKTYLGNFHPNPLSCGMLIHLCLLCTTSKVCSYRALEARQ